MRQTSIVYTLSDGTTITVSRNDPKRAGFMIMVSVNGAEISNEYRNFESTAEFLAEENLRNARLQNKMADSGTVKCLEQVYRTQLYPMLAQDEAYYNVTTQES